MQTQTQVERAKEIFKSYDSQAWAVEIDSETRNLTGLDRWNVCQAMAWEELKTENEKLQALLAEKDAEIASLKAELETLKKAEPVAEAAETAAEEKKTVTVSFECDSHPYKGSRKAWAAIVELTASGNLKQDSRRFLDHCATRSEGAYRFKEYEIEVLPGTVIETNSSGSKSSDDRSLWRVSETGELESIR